MVKKNYEKIVKKRWNTFKTKQIKKAAEKNSKKGIQKKWIVHVK